MDGAAIPAPGMDQPGPDASQLAPQEQQKPEARYGMQHEDEPLLREATHQTDNAGCEGEDGGERKTPVGEARGHTRSSLYGFVSFFTRRGLYHEIFQDTEEALSLSRLK